MGLPFLPHPQLRQHTLQGLLECLILRHGVLHCRACKQVSRSESAGAAMTANHIPHYHPETADWQPRRVGQPAKGTTGRYNGGAILQDAIYSL